MKHPRSGFAASSSSGRHQRPGQAGSAVALVFGYFVPAYRLIRRVSEIAA
ncbi:hypothetical protein JI739_14860 [Ramlibacter sp. AW1]|uniref:Uncharacterized protein n=1 Tax=Ramlibacter aurantiacus TaxID=2801330 RepID=A0A936ZUZ4_9BURK|nr:hypothetical protein [Ramlibacter aurantiacus]MBL0421635.1 hypothetical protein [Ramlibacter aurantiacus]